MSTVLALESVPTPAYLQDGDLVLRLGNGYFSNLFRQYASKDQVYSHVGLIHREGDSVYVIHTEASELTGVGYVRKELLRNFLEDIRIFTYYKNSLSEIAKKAVIDQALVYYTKQVPFDLEFNSQSDDRLYCSELVASSINLGLDSLVVKPTMKRGDKWVYSLDDLYNQPFYEEITEEMNK